MQIPKVQSNNQSFGTKVKIDPYAARIISLSSAKRKILRDIKKLESNGNDDLLSLSLNSKGQKYYYVDATLYEKKNGKHFLSFPHSERMITIQEDGTRKHVSILDLYKDAKKSLNKVVVDVNSFKNFAKYI